MENVSEINRKIADNLIRCRKAAGMTQAEVAEKINYSDKSVSKWESGNGIPDVYTLMQLAELFHVTLNELVGEKITVPTDEALRNKKKTKWLHLLIMLLSSGIVWLVATCLFVILDLTLSNKDGLGLCFLYALVAQAIVLIVYSGVWRYRLIGFCSISLLIWITLVCIYSTAKTVFISNGADHSGLWVLFLVGIPLQVLEVLWVFFRSFFHRDKNKKKQKSDKKAEEEQKKA